MFPAGSLRVPFVFARLEAILNAKAPPKRAKTPPKRRPKGCQTEPKRRLEQQIAEVGESSIFIVFPGKGVGPWVLFVRGGSATAPPPY